MRYDRQKNERKSLKFWIITWALLTGYLIFHTWQWDPTTPFLTTDLLVPWFIFAIILGLYSSGSAWDLVHEACDLQLWQALGFGCGFLLYILMVLAFNAGVFVGMLFALDSAMSHLNPNASIELVTIHSSIGPEANRYLLLLFFIAVTISQTFSVSKPLARWFSKNMESWLKLSTRPTSETRYFRTMVQPGGRVNVTSPELEAGRAVDVVVRPIKCRMGREE